MKKIAFLLSIFCFSQAGAQQSPCSANPLYRQFDFWIGEWEVYALNGKKAGDSKISLILDSCILFEEWTSAKTTKGVAYSGKSFNTYNALTNEWQQTWVDNAGGSNHYDEGKFENNSLVFQTKSFTVTKDTIAIRKLSFFNLGGNKVRQLGQISKNEGANWTTEYDLEYRRKSK